MKILLYLWVSLGVLGLRGQSQWQKTIKASAIDAIAIDLRFIQKLSVVTDSSDQILIKTLSEGEYRDDLIVIAREEDNWLEVYPQWIPSFISPNDKLSAHKVRALSLELVIPEGKTIEVRGEHALIDVSGHYRQLFLRLGGGTVHMTHNSESSDVRTSSADIFLTIPSGDVHSASELGKVVGKVPYNPQFHYELATKQGSIYLNQLRNDS